MNQTYSLNDLRELADRQSTEASVMVVGACAGVALPNWCHSCAILLPESARRLGAQLLLAADELRRDQGTRRYGFAETAATAEALTDIARGGDEPR